MSQLAVCCTLALGVSGAFSQTPAGQIDAGRKAYMQKMCYTCHGTVGQGGDRGSGPRIAPDPWPYEAFVQQTRRPRGVMPRYPVEFLSDSELAEVYAYVSSFKDKRKAADIPLLRQ